MFTLNWLTTFCIMGQTKFEFVKSNFFGSVRSSRCHNVCLSGTSLAKSTESSILLSQVCHRVSQLSHLNSSDRQSSKYFVLFVYRPLSTSLSFSKSISLLLILISLYSHQRQSHKYILTYFSSLYSPSRYEPGVAWWAEPASAPCPRTWILLFSLLLLSVKSQWPNWHNLDKNWFIIGSWTYSVMYIWFQWSF